MKVITYRCDCCNGQVAEDDVTKVSFNHGKGRFDLRDEEFDLCPACDVTMIAQFKLDEKGKPKGRKP